MTLPSFADAGYEGLSFVFEQYSNVSHTALSSCFSARTARGLEGRRHSQGQQPLQPCKEQAASRRLSLPVASFTAAVDRHRGGKGDSRRGRPVDINGGVCDTSPLCSLDSCSVTSDESLGPDGGDSADQDVAPDEISDVPNRGKYVQLVRSDDNNMDFNDKSTIVKGDDRSRYADQLPLLKHIKDEDEVEANEYSRSRLIDASGSLLYTHGFDTRFATICFANEKQNKEILNDDSRDLNSLGTSSLIVPSRLSSVTSFDCKTTSCLAEDKRVNSAALTTDRAAEGTFSTPNSIIIGSTFTFEGKTQKGKLIQKCSSQQRKQPRTDPKAAVVLPKSRPDVSEGAGDENDISINHQRAFTIKPQTSASIDHDKQQQRMGALGSHENQRVHPEPHGALGPGSGQQPGSCERWGRAAGWGRLAVAKVAATAAAASTAVRWALNRSRRSTYRACCDIVRYLVSMDHRKSASLGALVLQTSALALTIRYSRTERVEEQGYLPAAIASELLKMMGSLCVLRWLARRRRLHEDGCPWQEVLDTGQAVRVSVPAALYTLQNKLHFLAASHLDAVTFQNFYKQVSGCLGLLQATSQLQILTTAFFSVLLLHRRVDCRSWTSLVVLTAGVALVQLPDSHQRRDKALGSPLIGLAAVLAMCVCSGLAGVYLEKLLKASDTVKTMWTINFQMAFISIVLTMLSVSLGEWPLVKDKAFFQGYSIFVALIIFQQAMIELMVSLVMKYAGNILKCFASAGSAIFTSAVSALILGDQLSLSFLFGSTVVTASVLLYTISQHNTSYSSAQSLQIKQV